MALDPGTVNADSGMSLAIYEKLNFYLSPPLQKAVDEAEGEAKVAAQEALDGAREGWKKLSYSIAFGVIEYIKVNMEIVGIKTQGDVDTTVKGETGLADPGNHKHTLDLTGQQIGVEFIQSNDGMGHIK